MRVRLMLLALGLAVAATGARAAAPAACGLATAAEVGAAVGATMAQGPSVNGPGGSSCQWKGGGVTVIVSAKSAQAFETGKKALAPTPVSGIGDEAYQTGNSLSYTVLSARKGQNAVSVTVRGLKDVAAVQAAERAVGKVAVGRL